MITERHNVACRLIMKAISRCSLAGYLVHLDAGSINHLVQQSFQIPVHATISIIISDYKILPSWLCDARLSASD